jgi:hypothetical protein
LIAAIVFAVGIMLGAADAIGAFVNRHPTLKILALSFLLLIGMALLADGFALHIPKGNRAMQKRDRLGGISDDARFADLFGVRGRPAEAPWHLAVVTVL